MKYIAFIAFAFVTSLLVYSQVSAHELPETGCEWTLERTSLAIDKYYAGEMTMHEIIDIIDDYLDSVHSAPCPEPTITPTPIPTVTPEPTVTPTPTSTPEPEKYCPATSCPIPSEAPNLECYKHGKTQQIQFDSSCFPSWYCG